MYIKYNKRQQTNCLSLNSTHQKKRKSSIKTTIWKVQSEEAGIKRQEAFLPARENKLTATNHSGLSKHEQKTGPLENEMLK